LIASDIRFPFKRWATVTAVGFLAKRHAVVLGAGADVKAFLDEAIKEFEEKK
jgi:hypothetical protein